ncbi:hypothetical protein TNCV_3785591 [Trichonephila clavipes]|nr:hypothetical protein TNCV_3785591 [Trichonephila clavipes]
MALSDSLPQINLGVQGGTQGVLTHCALLVESWEQNGDSATDALRKLRSLKQLRKGPLSSQGLTNTIRFLKQHELWRKTYRKPSVALVFSVLQHLLINLVPQFIRFFGTYHDTISINCLKCSSFTR